jgi:DNA segregation ATPase FtsK/SpoIIIE, S-DNA-T family
MAEEKRSFDKGREVVGVFYLVAALILAVSYYFPGSTGPFGAALLTIGRGFLGVTAYAVPAILLYMAMDHFLEREEVRTRLRFVHVTVLLTAASALVHLLSMPAGALEELSANAADSLLQLWRLGADPSRAASVLARGALPGGLGGGLLAEGLLAVVGRTGAAILLVGAMLAEIVILFNISLAKAFDATRKKVGDAIAQGAASVRSPKRADGANYDMVVGKEAGAKRKESAPAAPEAETPPFDVPPFLAGAPDASSKAGVSAAPVVPGHEPYEEDDEGEPVEPAPGGIRPARVDVGAGRPSGSRMSHGNAPSGAATGAGTGEGSGDASSVPPRPYVFPPLELLAVEPPRSARTAPGAIEAMSRKLEDTLASFGLEAKVVNVTTGPAITRFELAPGAGVKISRIVSLQDDIALNLAALGVRIEAPIPGKAAIGIEVPNRETAPVLLRRMLETNEFRAAPSPLTVALGRDIPGAAVVADIARMPHLLIAGATGSGKSVCINSMILAILYKAKPSDVRMLMIDPKVVELSVYNGIPHLLAPVVTDPKKAAGALLWAVAEMTRRYNAFAERSVRDIVSHNAQAEAQGFEKLPLILVVIDELSDLMVTSPAEVEDAIARLTAMARAAGIHLVVATQRPSVDVVTGVIKANIPSRLAFAVSSQVDSRTILDMGGAEKLLGRGDMLYFPVGASKPVRAQGAFVSEKEVERVVAFLKQQGAGGYDEATAEAIGTTAASVGSTDEPDQDELLPQAVQIVIEAGYASVSLLQRRMNVGYPRAARLVDRMQEKGFVGPFEGSKPRKVLVSMSQWLEYKQREGI